MGNWNHHSPSQPSLPKITNCLLNISIANAEGASVVLSTDLSGKFSFVADEGNPNRLSLKLLTGGGTGATVVIQKDGCVSIAHRLTLADGTEIPIPFSGAWELQGEELRPVLPPDYSREKALGVNTSFMGGLVIPTQQFGLMPFWDAALSWMQIAQDRQLVYAAKKANNETHCILHIPNGPPLYDEAGQFYSPDKFGPKDWTNGETQLTQDFVDLLKEILTNGFAFHITMDEIQEHSFRIIALVAQALKDLGVSKDGFTMPGYDGVFYGWLPEAIQHWGALARSINPDILLGLEFNSGHLPLGEGSNPPDYSLNGRMKDFDIILSEANSFGPTVGPCDDTTWQIVGRCVHPYNRPSDEPQGDDPAPPFVLADSERGSRFFCYFETGDPYAWVRINPNDSEQVRNAQNRINFMRQYARNLGCAYTG